MVAATCTHHRARVRAGGGGVNESDPAVAYERLKIETAWMLRLNVASSSLLENLQVDLVIAASASDR